MVSHFYRQEALAHLAKASRLEGRLAESGPAWLGKAYAAVVMSILICIPLSVWIRLPTHRSLPGRVYSHGVTVIQAPVSGTVFEVFALDRQAVQNGEHLAKVCLSSYLDCADEGIAIKAPHEGTISGLLLTRGQRLTVGQSLGFVSRHSAGFEVVARVPAPFRRDEFQLGQPVVLRAASGSLRSARIDSVEGAYVRVYVRITDGNADSYPDGDVVTIQSLNRIKPLWRWVWP